MFNNGGIYGISIYLSYFAMVTVQLIRNGDIEGVCLSCFINILFGFTWRAAYYVCFYYVTRVDHDNGDSGDQGTEI